MGALLTKRFYEGAQPHPIDTMRAVSYSSPGAARDVLEYSSSHPRPLPNPDTHVFIQVYASGLNPVDFKFRAHPLPSFFIPKPKITGGDVSGVVLSSPPGSKFQPGDRVCALMPLIGSRWGSCAEYAAISEDLVAPVPDNITLTEAASLPLVGLTVLEGMKGVISKMDHKTKDKKVFIQAGSGGVGSIAIQYCKHVLDMYVSTTCSAMNAALCRKLGADQTIDYRNENFAEKVQQFDVVFDVLAYKFEKTTMEQGMLRKGDGHYVHIAASDWDIGTRGYDWLNLSIPEARPDRVIGSLLTNLWYAATSWMGWTAQYHGPVFVHPNGRGLEEFMGFVAEGKVRPVIDRVFSLEDTADAHVYLEAGHATGKVVIVVKEEEGHNDKE